ncbi:hypothetical protein [Bacillus cereus]|uniref:hypothetical protein n=1 Tax=Bacillus cereus TaxID=1396 RepID=UPI000BFE07C6|nr:hypothetical protein [Bacillus cereus]PGW18308.1 hypothetical protein COD88_30145 [Bacillus cereus]
MKKIYLFVGFLMGFIVCNLDGIKVEAAELNVKQIKHLESLGFTKEEISDMPEMEIMKNLEIDGQVVATKEKFIKVTENGVNNSSKEVEIDKNTYLNEVQLEEAKRVQKSNGVEKLSSNTNTTSYKKVTTNIVSLKAKQKYRVKTSIEWSVMPSNRKIDVIGTGVNSSFWAPSPGSQYGQQKWKLKYDCNKTKSKNATYTKDSNKWSKGSSGYALNIDLPNDVNKSYACYNEKVLTLSAFSYYTVEKLASTTQIDAYGKYLHQETTFQVSPSISFSPLTFGVSASQSDKFTETTTHAQVKF